MGPELGIPVGQKGLMWLEHGTQRERGERVDQRPNQMELNPQCGSVMGIRGSLFLADLSFTKIKMSPASVWRIYRGVKNRGSGLGKR